MRKIYSIIALFAFILLPLNKVEALQLFKNRDKIDEVNIEVQYENSQYNLLVDIDYKTKDKKSEIRKELKKLFPEYKISLEDKGKRVEIGLSANELSKNELMDYLNSLLRNKDGSAYENFDIECKPEAKNIFLEQGKCFDNIENSDSKAYIKGKKVKQLSYTLVVDGKGKATLPLESSVDYKISKDMDAANIFIASFIFVGIIAFYSLRKDRLIYNKKFDNKKHNIFLFVLSLLALASFIQIAKPTSNVLNNGSLQHFILNIGVIPLIILSVMMLYKVVINNDTNKEFNIIQYTMINIALFYGVLYVCLVTLSITIYGNIFYNFYELLFIMSALLLYGCYINVGLLDKISSKLCERNKFNLLVNPVIVIVTLFVAYLIINQINVGENRMLLVLVIFALLSLIPTVFKKITGSDVYVLTLILVLGSSIDSIFDVLEGVEFNAVLLLVYATILYVVYANFDSLTLIQEKDEENKELNNVALTDKIKNEFKSLVTLLRIINVAIFISIIYFVSLPFIGPGGQIAAIFNKLLPEASYDLSISWGDIFSFFAKSKNFGVDLVDIINTYSNVYAKIGIVAVVALFGIIVIGSIVGIFKSIFSKKTAYSVIKIFVMIFITSFIILGGLYFVANFSPVKAYFNVGSGPWLFFTASLVGLILNIVLRRKIKNSIKLEVNEEVLKIAETAAIEEVSAEEISDEKEVKKEEKKEVKSSSKNKSKSKKK